MIFIKCQFKNRETLHSEISHSVESRFGVGASKIEWEKYIKRICEYYQISRNRNKSRYILEKVKPVCKVKL